MQKHAANISWSRQGADFANQRYSRAHEWHFDGGAKVAASASPANVPVPFSVPEAVDPEEALVAAASSCHMLWFLSIAAKRGFVVDSYVDQAFGLIEQNRTGKLAFSRIILQPLVEFAGQPSPSAEHLAEMHQMAHNSCFIANSLNCDVIVAAT